MATLRPFEIEQWMEAHEKGCTHNLAESCSDSLTLAGLSALNPAIPFALPTGKLDYGHIRGSPEFRQNVSGLYSPQVDPENVLITSGAIAANYLVLYGLLKLGDHVICVYPTYQQLYDLPKSFGAEVELWKLRRENGYVLDVEELKGMIRKPKDDGTGGTSLIIINNPNNPTGVVTPTKVLKEIVAVASPYNIKILSDEVYRPLFHSSSEPTPASILDLYPAHGIATSSLSKAYALAGIRIGWIASHSGEIMTKLAGVRDYNTISVSQLDDAVATYALSPHVRPKILERNTKLCETNLKILEDWLQAKGRRDKFDWVKPTGGTTVLVTAKDRTGRVMDDVWLCKQLHEKASVLIAPAGLCFGHGKDFEGSVRIGYACDTEVLKNGLAAWGEWLKTQGI
ncbi:pyridoxal phosphate-dependent transferase [Geopyxis carbonaria]|nr:pyridoxal phosphate-dependent transferase [Geopyxis carbonaria]